MNRRLLLVALALPVMQSDATDLFAGAGRADYQMCGGPGCWHQEPLPWTSSRNVGETTIGLDTDRLRLAVTRVNRAYVSGTYVADAQYDPVRRVVKSWNPMHYTTAMTTGATLATVEYRSTADIGFASVTGRAGIAVGRQWTNWVYGDWATTGFSSNRYTEGGRVLTPAAGLDVTAPLWGSWSASASIDLYHDVTVKQAPVGGDSNFTHRPGLASVGFSINYTI